MEVTMGKMRSINVLPKVIGEVDTSWSKKSSQGNCSSHELTTNKKSPLTKLFTFMLRFYYRLCLVPFYPLPVPTYRNNVGEDVRFRFKTWIPQKIISGLFTICGFVVAVKTLRSLLPNKPTNPAQHLSMVIQLSDIMQYGAFIKMLWMDQTKLLEILTMIHRAQSQISDKQFRIGLGLSAIVWASTILQTAYGILDMRFPTGYENGTKTYEALWKSWYKEHVRKWKRSLFIEEFHTGANWNTVFGILSICGRFFRNQHDNLAAGMIFMASLTLWVLTKQFTNPLNDDIKGRKDVRLISPKLDWKTVEERFNTLVELSEAINEVFGNLTVYYVLNRFLYLGLALNRIVTKYDKIGLTLAIYGWYILHFVTVLSNCADITHKVRKLKVWMIRTLDRKEIMGKEIIIMNELDSGVISIKIGNLFPICYSLLVQILVVMLTYYLIYVQYE